MRSNKNSVSLPTDKSANSVGKAFEAACGLFAGGVSAILFRCGFEIPSEVAEREGSKKAQAAITKAKAVVAAYDSSHTTPMRTYHGRGTEQSDIFSESDLS